MRQLPEENRPRERLTKLGAEALTDTELLAILFRTGTKTKDALALATQLLVRFKSLQRLSQTSIEELQSVEGIGKVKAIELKAALELGKRATQYRRVQQPRIQSPTDVIQYLDPNFRVYESEYFLCIELSKKHTIIAIETVGKGGLDGVSALPRDVFKQALRDSAAAVILVHNHPSGDPQPSVADIQLTQRLITAGNLIGIQVLDHIIVGDGNYVSLREKGLVQF